MLHSSARQSVVEACRLLLERGYLKATEGNVSARLPGGGCAVTPSNYDYARMRPADIAILDADGHQIDGELKASVEAGMHAGIYAVRPDVNAIVHTHLPYASALALLRREIPVVTDEQARFLGRGVPLIDYAPSGTGLLAASVRKQVAGGQNAFILANHGVLALGADADHAVFATGLLEKVATAYLMALLTEGEGGARVHTIPAPIREIALAKLRADQAAMAARVTEAAAPRPVPLGPLPSADAEAAAWASRPLEGGASEETRSTTDGWASSSELGYAISAYPDVPDTLRRLGALLAQPVRGLRHDAQLDVLDWFETHATASKAMTARAKARIPGGVQHNLAFNFPFPLAIERAEGAHLYDIDGNRYIDFLQAGGPTILGSNHPVVRERVADLLASCGPVTGLFHEYELKLAEAIHHFMPHVELYRSLGSGTEGVMAAVRAARAFTGKDVVIKVGGAYHGWSDTMVYGLRVPGTWRMNAKGIPFGATASTRELFPHDLAGLKRKLIENRARGGTAAVIVEPVGPESGTRPVPRGFNASVRELCDEFGALLVFDEVVTGFRLGMGGASGYFDVTPDLTVFGKAVAGGYPMAGGVGGRADVMAAFGSGLDGKSGAHIQVGGTLSANPLSCAAGFFAIEEMARTNAPVIAGRAGDRLAAGLSRIVAARGLPYVVYNTGSIVHLETSGVMLLDARHPLKLARENKPRKKLMEVMGAAYAAHGIITLAGSRLYTSMADTDEVIDDALARFDQVFSLVEGV